MVSLIQKCNECGLESLKHDEVCDACGSDDWGLQCATHGKEACEQGCEDCAYKLDGQLYFRPTDLGEALLANRDAGERAVAGYQVSVWLYSQGETALAQKVRTIEHDGTPGSDHRFLLIAMLLRGDDLNANDPARYAGYAQQAEAIEAVRQERVAAVAAEAEHRRALVAREAAARAEAARRHARLSRMPSLALRCNSCGLEPLALTEECEACKANSWGWRCKAHNVLAGEEGCEACAYSFNGQKYYDAQALGEALLLNRTSGERATANDQISRWLSTREEKKLEDKIRAVERDGTPGSDHRFLLIAMLLRGDDNLVFNTMGRHAEYTRQVGALEIARQNRAEEEERKRLLAIRRAATRAEAARRRKKLIRILAKTARAVGGLAILAGLWFWISSFKPTLAERLNQFKHSSSLVQTNVSPEPARHAKPFIAPPPAAATAKRDEMTSAQAQEFLKEAHRFNGTAATLPAPPREARVEPSQVAPKVTPGVVNPPAPSTIPGNNAVRNVPPGPLAIYNVPDLKKLMGTRPKNAGLRGDFVVVSHANGHVILQTRMDTKGFFSFTVNGQQGLLKGNTLVDLVDSNHAGPFLPNNLITFTAEAPLRIKSVGKNAQGQTVVEASF